MTTFSRTILICFLFSIAIAIIFTQYSCNGGVSAETSDSLRNMKTRAELQHFINENKDSNEGVQAKKILHQMIYDSVCRLNTRKAYTEFVKQFPDAEQKEKAQKKIEQLSGPNPVISTFRGDNQRNYFGDRGPSRLDEIWTSNMGSGKSFAYGKMWVWTGAGWTGQPLIVEENEKKYIIQGCFDYNLKKIDASNGKVIWKYKFDDIIKGTATIWVNQNAATDEEKLVIMQGSRRGEGTKGNLADSYRGISYATGKELWRMNSKKTPSYSRDVDGSAVVLGDTAYIDLENGIFTVFSPDPKNGSMREGIFQPAVHQETNLWNEADIKAHGGNLVAESSPTVLDNKIYIISGSGHVYGYNLNTKKIDWDYYIGCDMDGSAPVTHDKCLLVSVEKEYIKGDGGVFKLDPSKPEKEAALWFFPTISKHFAYWDGGVVGSVAVNDRYIGENETHIAAFLAVDGNLYVVDHDKITEETAIGPDGVTKYKKPKLLFKQYVGASIASPIIVGNKIVACTYEGIFLFEHDKNMNFKLLDKKKGISFEASPICDNGKIYVVSNTTGLMYCFGEK